MGWIDKLNRRVACSPIGRWFRLEGSGAKVERAGAKFTVELRAGLTTFVTMAYIISVNATIIQASGGTCDCDREQFGNDCADSKEYEQCLQELKLDLITATSVVSCIACLLMGVFANLPFALAPGMGLNAYFAYTVVGFHGTGKVTYQNALAAVCLEGIIFFVISFFGLRQWFARLIPVSLKTAAAAGIGLFLAFIGLQSSAGIGLITSSPATLVELGGCPPEYRNSNTNVCESHHMRGGPTWLGILGLMIVIVLTQFRVRGAILVGILFVSIVSWPRPTAVTYFPYTDAGNAAFDYFKKVVTFHPIKHTLAVFHWDLSSGDLWMALITFLYVDILDCTGAMMSMAKFAGFMNESTQDFEGSTMGFLSDSASIVIGAVFGVSPVTVLGETGAGIAEGGKTGIHTVMVSFCFFVSIFFSPIFASFPPWATGPALIMVGSMMTQNILNVNWGYIGDSIPAFITIVMIPFSYSIGYGLIGGIGSFIIVNSIVLAVDKLSGGRWVPHNYEDRDDWIGFIKQGGLKSTIPPWMYRICGKTPPEIEPYYVEESSDEESDEEEGMYDNDHKSNISDLKDANSHQPLNPHH